jgi:hypothetical protein
MALLCGLRHSRIRAARVRGQQGCPLSRRLSAFAASVSATGVFATDVFATDVAAMTMTTA